MYTVLIALALCNLLYFALHITGSGSFPKTLNAKEEREYLLRVREGDPEARNMLIEHNLRLVAHIIKKYYQNFKEQEDLISIGTIGLIKAVSTFDCEKGTKFATYASRCIENEILMHFRGRRKFSQDVYINDPIDTDKDGNALSFGDILADETSIYDQVDLKLKSEQLYRFIAKSLEPREREILFLRYGLCGQIPLTQREVADKLCISRSYVSRLEKKALERLKEQFEATGSTEA